MPRGWLLVLSAVLLVWHPVAFALEAASTLPTLGMRGTVGVLELLLHGLVAALSFAAGWALWHASPAGPRLARTALAAGAVVNVQALYWSVLPSNVFPSDRLPLAAVALAHSGAWLVYLARSKRIRAIEGA